MFFAICGIWVVVSCVFNVTFVCVWLVRDMLLMRDLYIWLLSDLSMCVCVSWFGRASFPLHVFLYALQCCLCELSLLLMFLSVCVCVCLCVFIRYVQIVSICSTRFVCVCVRWIMSSSIPYLSHKCLFHLTPLSCFDILTKSWTILSKDHHFIDQSQKNPRSNQKLYSVFGHCLSNRCLRNLSAFA